MVTNAETEPREHRREDINRSIIIMIIMSTMDVSVVTVTN